MRTVGNGEKALDGVKKYTVALFIDGLTVWKSAPSTVWKSALEFILW